MRKVEKMLWEEEQGARRGIRKPNRTTMVPPRWLRNRHKLLLGVTNLT